jgi:hypothetical protein
MRSPTVMSVAGLAVGWRIRTLWLGILLGTIARSPDAVTGIVFVVIFPLTFVANASCRPARSRASCAPRCRRRMGVKGGHLGGAGSQRTAALLEA